MGKRQKWGEYIGKKLSSVIFVSSLASFDQVKQDDPSSNCFEESLGGLIELTENKLLRECSIIVLFNKNDIFKRKLKQSLFSDYILDYNGKPLFN
jgi:hypothetical protein